MQRQGTRFDGQAGMFDARAGVGPDTGRAVADALLETAGCGPRDLLVEIGAGTGEVGQFLAGRVRYLGIDSSASMLAIFRARLAAEAAGGAVQLVQSDAEQAWPVDDGAAAAVFAARVAHLLDGDHLAAEVRRVCRSGGALLLGRVRRSPDSPRERLRRQREALLSAAGTAPGAGRAATTRLLDGMVGAGAARIPPRSVARWTTWAAPEAVLRNWETMAAAGGSRLGARAHADVLARLRQWATAELGDLSRVTESFEEYTIEGVRLPPGGSDVPPNGNPHRPGE